MLERFLRLKKKSASTVTRSRGEIVGNCCDCLYLNENFVGVVAAVVVFDVEAVEVVAVVLVVVECSLKEERQRCCCPDKNLTLRFVRAMYWIHPGCRRCAHRQEVVAATAEATRSRSRNSWCCRCR